MSNLQEQACQAQASGLAGLAGLGAQAATAAPNTVRSNAGELQIQGDRCACLVIRLRQILDNAGITQMDDRKEMAQDSNPCPNDLHSTLEIAQNTVRSANNQLEDLLNTMESTLL